MSTNFFTSGVPLNSKGSWLSPGRNFDTGFFPSFAFGWRMMDVAETYMKWDGHRFAECIVHNLTNNSAWSTRPAAEFRIFHGIFEPWDSENPVVSRQHGIFGEPDSENSAISKHRGIFGEPDSENPAVSESSRDFWRTRLRKSRGLQKPRDYRRTWLQKSRCLESSREFWRTRFLKSRGLQKPRNFWRTRLRKSCGLQTPKGFSENPTPKIPRSRTIAGFSDDFTPKIPRSRVIAGFSDVITPKYQGLESSGDFGTTSLRKSGGIKKPRGFGTTYSKNCKITDSPLTSTKSCFLNTLLLIIHGTWFRVSSVSCLIKHLMTPLSQHLLSEFYFRFCFLSFISDSCLDSACLALSLDTCNFLNRQYDVCGHAIAKKV